MEEIDGIWFCEGAGYLVFDSSGGYVISAHRVNVTGGKFIAYAAWFREIEKFVVEIKLCKLAESSPWQRVFYRYVEQKLQWSINGKDFIFERVNLSDVCEDAVLPIERVATKHMKEFSRG